nr:MAG TPA: hypothetical protein [Caudoviricetes sp.]
MLLAKVNNKICLIFILFFIYSVIDIHYKIPLLSISNLLLN